jgi:predicted nuclease of predicted toxin-antitoxin system
MHALRLPTKLPLFEAPRRFVVDVCAGRKLAHWLRAQGHDVVEVRDRDMRMSDEDILSWAESDSRILITLDKDFGQLHFQWDRKHSGMVRLPDLPSVQRIALVREIIGSHENDLAAGRMVTSSGGKTRVT